MALFPEPPMSRTEEMIRASRRNLSALSLCVDRVCTVPAAEEHVRLMLAKFARSCPTALLQKLGQCVIDHREEELKQKAEGN